MCGVPTGHVNASPADVQQVIRGIRQAGRQPVLLGLGLWTDEPNTIGRVNLGPQQWLDVLRLRVRES